MGDTSPLGGKLNDSGAVEITGKIMVVAILVLFFVVVSVFLLHLYAKWFWNRRQENSSNPNTTRGRRRRLDFVTGYQAALRRGLDPSVLKTIPVVVFSAKDFKDGMECAVCLSEVSEGEKARLLPKCNHGFHMECIDMWFQSHSTCPLCRDAVSPEGSESATTLESILQVPVQENPNANGGHSTEPLNFPTNVLFWGDETQVSTFGNCLEEGHQIRNPSQPPASSSSSSNSLSNNRTNGTLIIDIPRQIQEDEESKSPVPTRLRSLKRLLSRDIRLSPRSPRDLDVEQQGVRG